MAPAFPVNTPAETKNSTLTVSPRYAAEGSTVTITAEPDSGYQLDKITAVDASGKELELKDLGGRYSFAMPGGAVEIKADFIKKAETSPFQDVSTDADYYDAVKWAAEKSVTAGVGGGLFGPDESCTRAQAVTFLYRICAAA